MEAAAQFMLFSGALLAAGVLSSRISSRAGLPVILLFLAVGLVVAELDPELVTDPVAASGLATVLLALILFDGGLGTPAARIRQVLGPAVTLATLGVVVTVIIVAAVASLALGFSPTEALLLGSIIGSTDAAAVFTSLRGRGASLVTRVRTLLEVESGLNDPVAVFLTLSLTAALATGSATPKWWELGIVFVHQMLIGGVLGLATGWGTGWVMRRLHLDQAGLYLVLSVAAAFLAFGAAQELGGSGVIAVYGAGVVLGGSRIPIDRGIRRFHDGVAWISQVGVFVLLGAFATPKLLLAEAPRGLVVAAVLVFLARPLAVVLSTAVFGYGGREQIVLSVGGLRGAVPVILGTIPLAAGVDSGPVIFHAVFFAVLVSVLVQGTLFGPVAKWLGLTEPDQGQPPVSLELTALRETGQELLGYRVEPTSPAAGKLIRDLPLPADALIPLVVRGNEVIAPRGSTRLEPTDQVYVLHKTGSATVVATLFAPSPPDDASLTVPVPLALDATLATLGDITSFYGVDLGGDPDQVLAEWLEDRLGWAATPGDRFELPQLTLVVLSTRRGRPHQVAVEISVAHER